MNRKERLHRIWKKLEHIATELGEALEDARNGEQVELLRDEVGITPILSDMLALLRQIQRSSHTDFDYLVQVRIKTIDRLKERIEEILENEQQMETGGERKPKRETE